MGHAASTTSIKTIGSAKRAKSLPNSRRTGKADLARSTRRQPTDGYDHMKSVQSLGG